MLKAVLPFSARQFARAIIMPNLTPPVTDREAASAYRSRIVEALPDGLGFHPLMTAYLTDDSDPDELIGGFNEGLFAAVKMYPANATTNSAHGVTDWTKVRAVFAAMENAGMPLLVHGEVTDTEIDIFDREAVFIDRVLSKIAAEFPDLKIVLEHVTTEDGVGWVKDGGPNIAATITPHHLMINRNAIFQGGLRPHMYCLPVAKRERHRLALREAATSGDPSFFLGTDSAPHPVHAKETDCGCAGIFNAPAALEAYVTVFDQEGSLDQFENFASLNGPNFYDRAVNEETVTLVRKPQIIPEKLAESEPFGPIVAFLGGEEIAWSIE